MSFSIRSAAADDRDAVWRYRLLLGWEQREFAATAYATHGAPVAEGELIWSPSGMDTVTVNGGELDANSSNSYSGTTTVENFGFERVRARHPIEGGDVLVVRARIVNEAVGAGL